MSPLRNSLHKNRVYTQERCVNSLFISKKFRQSNELTNSMLMHTYTFTYTRPHNTPSLLFPVFSDSLNKEPLLQTKRTSHTLVSTGGVF